MKVLLAVSGGADSMTMADIMFSHSRLYESLALAHCNFHLRPGDCDADEALVREWARERGLAFYRKDFDTAAYSAEHGVSIEMAARELRYAWFFDLCRENGYDTLAIAHNANDNAETLFLNLLRGTGLRGITGMAEADPFRFDGVTVIRPLLGMTRAQVEAYAAEHGVPYRTDSTNLECEYRRNRIRNQVFPIFEGMNPSFVQTLGRNMEHFRAAGAIVDDWCREQRRRVMPSEREILVPALLETPHWEYLLFDILDPLGFSGGTVEAIVKLIRDAFKPCSAAVPGEEARLRPDDVPDVSVSGRTFAGRIFEGRDCSLISASDRLVITEGTAPSSAQLPQPQWSTVAYREGMNLKCPKGTIMFDTDALPDYVEVRPWRHGDWMVPLGMTGRKKLSDLFTDLHLDLVQKSGMLVIAPTDPSDQHVYAVLGLRIDDSIKVTPSTVSVTVCKI